MAFLYVVLLENKHVIESSSLPRRWRMLEEHINRTTTAALMGNTPKSHKLEASFKVTTRLVKYL